MYYTCQRALQYRIRIGNYPSHSISVRPVRPKIIATQNGVGPIHVNVNVKKNNLMSVANFILIHYQYKMNLIVAQSPSFLNLIE